MVGTFASVTDKPCTCGFLERAADDPEVPIRFDTTTAEYHFQYPSPCATDTCPDAIASLIIHHCPFCGGTASPSKRPNLFATISQREQQRLYRLFRGMRTLPDVIKALGAPEEDKEQGLTVQAPEKVGKAPSVRTYRTLRYARLSDTADVEVYADTAEGKVNVTLLGKYIGPTID